MSDIFPGVFVQWALLFVYRNFVGPFWQRKVGTVRFNDNCECEWKSRIFLSLLRFDVFIRVAACLHTPFVCLFVYTFAAAKRIPFGLMPLVQRSIHCTYFTRALVYLCMELNLFSSSTFEYCRQLCFVVGCLFFSLFLAIVAFWSGWSVCKHVRGLVLFCAILSWILLFFIFLLFVALGFDMFIRSESQQEIFIEIFFF